MHDLDLPEFASDSIALLFAILESGTAKWREQLGKVSTEALRWQPVPDGHSIGILLLHMADVEGFWLHDVITGGERSADELSLLLSRETDQYASKWPIPPEQPLDTYFEQQDAVRQRTRTVFHDLTDRFDRVWQSKTFTLRWLLAHAIAHESYHGGQAVLLHEMFKAKTS